MDWADKARALTVAAGLMLAPTAAHSQAGVDLSALMPPFPSSVDRNVLTQWLQANADWPSGAQPIFTPDSALVIQTDSTADKPPGVHAVTFREEATQLGFVARNGGRSLSGAGDVHCADGTFRAESLVIFLGTGLKGERVTSFPPQSAARQPAPDSVIERVVQTVCAAPAAAAAPPVAERPEPEPAAPESPAPIPEPQATPEPPPPAAAATGSTAVQIGAFSSSAQAFLAFDELQKAVPDALGGRSQQVLPASSGGRTVYRAILSGFPSRSAAQDFCRGLIEQGRNCVVRP